MNERRRDYQAGPASDAEIRKHGDQWTLVLVRKLRQPPAMVWRALTDPAELSQWAPFDADRNLAEVGPVKLATVAMPDAPAAASLVKRAEAPRLLEYTWGGNDLRWQLEAAGGGTRLTLWHNIDRGFIAWGAAGWHLCLDVLNKFVSGQAIGRVVGAEAMDFGWQRLVQEYAQLLGVDANWPPKKA
ncbi:MAG TPA: SRPBCC family protein [Gammaproteobacteria bacterium]|jgi:uncharacterized protein YndB with AHSA1/START domain